MPDIQKNIDRYMDIKGYKHYSNLLVRIGRLLGVKDPYEFANREKSNFSKMLKGERPIKYEFIIPLEELLGVSMAKLLDEGAYMIPVEKEDIPYLKGFRYYAYKDDPELYEGEFERTMVTNEGFPTILNTDEFDKSFLDYVIEYRSVNGLRFLVEKHGLKPLPSDTRCFCIDGSNYISTSFENQLIKMAIQEDDPKLFEATFDPYTTCLLMGTSKQDLRLDSEVFEFLLNSEKVFESLFEPKTFPLPMFNHGIVGHDNDKIELLNPLLNLCLDFALANLDQYREKAKKILEFGIEYNQKALNVEGVDPRRLYVEEYGVVHYSRETIASIVSPEYKTDDPEMLCLIKKMKTVRKVGD